MTQIILAKLVGYIFGVFDEPLGTSNGALWDAKSQTDVISLAGTQTDCLAAAGQKVFEPVESGVTNTETSFQDIHQNRMVDCIECSGHI
jgi:hypothetical protein